MGKLDEKAAYTFTLGPELEKRAIKEIQEDPARRSEDIEHIRSWIKKQPHLNAKTDDWSILVFLRGCKFSLERTKEKIDMHYSLKTAIPEWFSGRDPLEPKTLEILKMGMLLPLPGVDKEGRRLFLNQAVDVDMKRFVLNDVMRALYCLIDVMMEEDELASITGAVNVMDMAKFSASQLLWYTPTNSKKIMIIWQDGYPMRPKGLHYFNTPSSFESMFGFFKNFMKEKMRKRLHVHGKNMESLYKFVPQSALPVEYGGQNGKLQDITDDWVNRVIERRAWLLEEETFRVDESKRPGKPKTSTDFFGLDGSFRKLNVD